MPKTDRKKGARHHAKRIQKKKKMIKANNKRPGRVKKK